MGVGIMMVGNIRQSMVEYHDILWDIGFAKTWEEAALSLDDLYAERPPIEVSADPCRRYLILFGTILLIMMQDFFAWRDLRVMEEYHWYG